MTQCQVLDDTVSSTTLLDDTVSSTRWWGVKY